MCVLVLWADDNMTGHDESTQVLNEPAPATKPEGFVAGVDAVMQSLERVGADIAATAIPI